ncbi:Uma2 family endonuclease [Caulobacter sp.]|uniref:Uma2 family endonuclease n=1 Tax=Caulobacter sp. TaxID=78 RepID=UPI001B17E0AA|nr:Uma2 family endonuclease [Caulobacter sp.]MBO9544945.1 Uma2 family endonuclease [Caulobacter sp.]
MNAFARALETSEQHRFTLDDVLRMQEAGILDEDARVELIDGVLVEMASEGSLHGWLKLQIAKRFSALGGDTVEVVVDTTLRLAPTYAPDPDIHVYDASLPFTGIDGANVGLIVEIAQSTVTKDLTLKAELYAEYGVRDYWVVDVNTDTVIVHRDPADGGYRDVVRYTAQDTVTALVLPDVTLRLADLPPIR